MGKVLSWLIGKQEGEAPSRHPWKSSATTTWASAPRAPRARRIPTTRRASKAALLLPPVELGLSRLGVLQVR